MNFPQSVSTCLKKYFDFTGRASRSEFWYFMLFYLLAGIVGEFIIMYLVVPRLNIGLNEALFYSAIFFLVLFIPALSVTVRRFHDFGVIGWMYLAFIFPYAISRFIQDAQPLLALIIDYGTLVIFLVYASRKPHKETNKYGPVPEK